MSNLQTYRVAEMYETIQGEGQMSGTPVTLLRLQGCSVACSWCDTKNSWSPEKGTPSSANEIVEMWKCRRKASDWILLTGGEPTEQPLRELVKWFVDFGANIMVETSGTARGLLDCHNLVRHVTLSPKAHKLPLQENVEIANELKLIVRDEKDVLFWREWLQTPDVARKVRNGLGVTVQPEFGSRPESVKSAVRAGRDYGWRVSFQMHKYLGLR